MKRLLIAIACIAIPGLAIAQSQRSSACAICTTSLKQFKKQFCRVNQNKSHVFVVSSSLFNPNKNIKIKCKNGTSTLRVHESRMDKGHYIYNIDPPKGVRYALDCDSKADIGMRRVAINCFPVYKEMRGHTRN